VPHKCNGLQTALQSTICILVSAEQYEFEKFIPTSLKPSSDLNEENDVNITGLLTVSDRKTCTKEFLNGVVFLRLNVSCGNHSNKQSDQSFFFFK
jgi:hypothetical protein